MTALISYQHLAYNHIWFFGNFLCSIHGYGGASASRRARTPIPGPFHRGDGIQLLKTEHTGVYAALRYNEEDALIVLINLTAEPIEAYELKLEEAVLNNGIFYITLLLGEGEVVPLKVEGGKFSDYVPLEALPPYSTFVMQLTP